MGAELSNLIKQEFDINAVYKFLIKSIFRDMYYLYPPNNEIGESKSE